MYFFVNDTVFDELYLKIFQLISLFLSFADPKFPMIAQIDHTAEMHFIFTENMKYYIFLVFIIVHKYLKILFTFRLLNNYPISI